MSFFATMNYYLIIYLINLQNRWQVITMVWNIWKNSSDTSKPDSISIFLSLFVVVRNGAFIVLWLGHACSSLRCSLISHLEGIDITLILFSTEEQLLHWLNTNPIAKVAALILESSIRIQDSLSNNQIYRTIRSILIRCRNDQLISLQRFSRSYRNVDGIYDNDAHLLIKLVLDLAFVSEELGDQEREDRNNNDQARRHYDRALKLCEIAKHLWIYR